MSDAKSDVPERQLTTQSLESSRIDHTQLDSLRLSLAAQLVPAGWRQPLTWLSQRLAAGQSWEQALLDDDWRPPADLRALVTTAHASGQPALIVLDIVQRHANNRQSWRTLCSSLVYPLAMLVVAMALTSLTMLSTFKMFELATLDPLFSTADIEPVRLIVADLQHVIYGLGIVLAWCLILLLTIAGFASPLARFNLIGQVPLFGSPFRWLALGELLSRLAVFSQYQASLSLLLPTVAASYGEHPLARITERLAKRITEGMSLQHAIHRTILSDRRAGVALTLIDLQSESLRQSLTDASQLLEQMAGHTCERLALILPLCILLLVASLMWATWSVCAMVFTAGFALFSSLV